MKMVMVDPHGRFARTRVAREYVRRTGGAVVVNIDTTMYELARVLANAVPHGLLSWDHAGPWADEYG